MTEEVVQEPPVTDQPTAVMVPKKDALLLAISSFGGTTPSTAQLMERADQIWRFLSDLPLTNNIALKKV